VHQTIYGAGVMLARRPEPADELRRQVTSPGGTTAAAMQVFEMKDLKRTVQEAVQNAARRSAQLAKS
jgi:pyrroline-5-carboxylate reductase